MYSIFAKNNYLISNFISYIKFHLFSDSVYYRYRGIILIVRGRPVPRVSLMAFLLLASGGGGGGGTRAAGVKNRVPTSIHAIIARYVVSTQITLQTHRTMSSHGARSAECDDH